MKINKIRKGCKELCNAMKVKNINFGEAGGGIRMGNTCKSMADSCQCMAKTTTILWSNEPPTNKNKWKKKSSLSKKKKKINFLKGIFINVSWLKKQKKVIICKT